MDYHAARFCSGLVSMLDKLQFKDPSVHEDYCKIEHLFEPGMSREAIKNGGTQ